MNSTSSERGLTRRGLLAVGGAAVVGAAGGALAMSSVDRSADGTASTPPANGTAEPAFVPFYDVHQAGIATPSPLLTTFVGLNLKQDSRDDAEAVLRLVTDNASRLTQGEPALGDTEPELAGAPANLTVTVGFGRSFFQRIGLATATPEVLAEIPPFSTDQLQTKWGQTDLMLQFGADDPTVLSHTMRVVLRDLDPLADVVWVQDGFRGPLVGEMGSMRNLMGQVDGTVNPVDEQWDEAVWVSADEPWVDGGTVLVLRRIVLHMDTWDELDRSAKELMIGRTLATGAPLGGEREDEPMDFTAVDDKGLPVIPANSHAAVAHAATTGEMILRRPFNYTRQMPDGATETGQLFAAYMSDPRRSFIPMQERIAMLDAFNEWNTTIGSATYFIPTGTAEGKFIAESLFA